MTLETRTRGTLSRFTLRKKDRAGVEDIEHLPIQIETERCDPDSHSTAITLHSLHGELAFPDADRTRQVLITFTDVISSARRAIEWQLLVDR